MVGKHLLPRLGRQNRAPESRCGRMSSGMTSFGRADRSSRLLSCVAVVVERIVLPDLRQPTENRAAGSRPKTGNLGRLAGELTKRLISKELYMPSRSRGR
jgi:hypothetical protein